jgi:pentatricopeptide repeat protein
MTPSAGVCQDVLATAARHGDAHLATEVFRVLSERKAVFESHDYELLMQTYLNSGDLKTALSVIPIIESARGMINRSSTRILFKYLQESPGRPAKAFAYLQELKDKNQDIPTPAINCVIEASVATDHFAQAIDQYRDLRSLSSNGPNTDTFNVLLRGCRMVQRKDVAMALVSEMLEARVSPDPLTYDRLMLVCLLENDSCDDAVNYFEELSARQWSMRAGTWATLVERLIDSKHPRLESVLMYGSAQGYSLDRRLQLKLGERHPDLLVELADREASRSPSDEDGFAPPLRQAPSYHF